MNKHSFRQLALTLLLSLSVIFATHRKLEILLAGVEVAIAMMIVAALVLFVARRTFAAYEAVVSSRLEPLGFLLTPLPCNASTLAVDIFLNSDEPALPSRFQRPPPLSN